MLNYIITIKAEMEHILVPEMQLFNNNKITLKFDLHFYLFKKQKHIINALQNIPIYR